MKIKTFKSFAVLFALAIGHLSMAQTSCDTIRNYVVPSDGSYTVFNGNANGIMLGHTQIADPPDTYVIKSWGEPYEATTAQSVRGVRMLPYKIVNNSGTANLTVQVHQFDWNTETPTTSLGSKTVNLNTFNDPMNFSNVMFDSPISVTGSYFVSYTFNRGTAQDTFALATTLVEDEFGFTMMQTTLAGATLNNEWHWVDEVYTFMDDSPIKMAFALDVLISDGTVPTASISLTEPNICVGGTFSPSGATTTGTVDSYDWYLTNTAISTIYNSATGVNPSITPGATVPSSASLILEVNGACHTVYEMVPVTISSAVSATVTPTSSDCTNNGVITISAVTGGVSTETATYRIGTGSFQSSNSFTGLAAGSYEIEVKKGGSGCTYTQTVTVGDAPIVDASFAYASSTVCTGGADVAPTTIVTAGGTFSATAGLIIDATTGVVDITDSPEGTHTITYTTAGACPQTSTQSLTITSSPNALFDLTASEVCGSGSNVQLDAFNSIGVFSGTTGLVINANTGEINVAASTAGTHVVTNSIAASGSCTAVSHEETLVIHPANNADFTYGSTAFCEGGTNPTITITGTAGTFTATSGLAVNGTTGDLDLTNAIQGSYIITNTVAATAFCPEVTATQAVVINAQPTADFAYFEEIFCATGNAAPSVPGTAGAFTSTSGLTINATTGVIDLAASTAGTYTITNTVAAANGCAAATEEATVTINALPIASVVLADLILAVDETAGATYQWIDCADDSEITGATSSTYAPSTPGSFKVVVTLDGCTATSTCYSVSDVSVSSVSMDNVAIFPNPATEVITIAGLTASQSTISVLDVNGKVIISQEITSAQADLTIGNVESGVYFIQVSSETINGTTRFIKK